MHTYWIQSSTHSREGTSSVPLCHTITMSTSSAIYLAATIHDHGLYTILPIFIIYQYYYVE